jgi:hypothetical protein
MIWRIWDQRHQRGSLVPQALPSSNAKYDIGCFTLLSIRNNTFEQAQATIQSSRTITAPRTVLSTSSANTSYERTADTTGAWSMPRRLLEETQHRTDRIKKH